MLRICFRAILLPLAAVIGATVAAHAAPDSRALPPPTPPSYADLADLAEQAPLVMRVKIRKFAEVDPARAGKVRPGWARLYVEAVTESLLAGPAAVGAAQRYLADVPRDAKGKLPKLKKQLVLLFARHVEGRAGELQLIAPDAQIPWTAETESRLRGVLAEVFSPSAPRRITGVREAIFVPGNLAGEGETQLFLSTADEEPAAITVMHQSGLPLNWSISYSEVVETAGRPPARDTLTWYRLACFLPAALPAGINVSATPEESAQAEADYRRVISDLGPCTRTRF